jgi:predicted metal-dependent phosphoesterase TrpH
MSNTITVTVDPHVHSEGSYDGHEPVELVLEHASDIGLDCVVITDHDEIDESLYAAEIAPEFGLIGVPGVEVSTAQGHLLAIGVEERPPRGETFDETVETVREMGGAAVVPHPFQRSRHGVRKRFIEDCDAVEVYNSMLFTGYRNRRADTFARRRDYPRVGASDAHYLPNVGRAYTEVTIEGATSAREVDSATLVDALRAGETAISGRRTPVHKSTRQYAKGAVKKSAYLLTRRLPVVPTVPASMGD